MYDDRCARSNHIKRTSASQQVAAEPGATKHAGSNHLSFLLGRDLMDGAAHVMPDWSSGEAGTAWPQLGEG